MDFVNIMQDRRAAKKAELDALLSAPTAETRDLTDVEAAEFDRIVEEIRKMDDRICELQAEEVRTAEAEKTRVEAGIVGEQRSARVEDAPVYARGNVEASYFRDLYRAQHEGDYGSAERLRRNDRQSAGVESRALSTTAGAVGEFAPPLWLIDEFIALARPGRKFVDSLAPARLPSGVASVNLPKVTGGSTTAVQTAQNAALSQTDMTSASVSSGISTIGGKQVVSLQLLTQSGIPFDEVILADLAADYARQFDTQVISGSGAAGQLNGVYTYFTASGTTNVVWTAASPAVGGANGFYSKVFNAAANIETARFVAPDTIWMHPRRWNWLLSSSDSAGRPLVVPAGIAAFNNSGTSDGVIAQGAVGTLGGLAVITDANIPTNLGAGVNQDPVFVGVRSDLRVWESDMDVQTFTSPYADSAGVLFRVLAFAAAIPGRYTSSVAVINGTGTVAPTY